MPRDFRVSLEDIVDAARWVETYVGGISLEQFQADRKTVDAVVRNLEVIGEAVKNIPQTVRDQHPHIPWQRVAALRDILIHEYFGIDMEILWDVVHNKLPLLKQQVIEILSEAEKDPPA